MRAHGVVLLSLVLFLGTPLNAQELTGTLADLKSSGKIRLGYRMDQPPMSFFTEQGRPKGYSVELCEMIVRETEKVIGRDLRIDYIPVSAENRFQALVENRIDLLCGATTKTLSRSESVDFTQLTFVTGATFMTLLDTKLVNNFEGKRIGVVKDTTTVEALRELIRETGVGAEVVLYATSSEMMSALAKGRVDAVSADQIVLIGLAIATGRPYHFTILPDLYSYEPFALALRRNDADFRLVADRVISGLYRSRAIVALHDRWFGKFATHRSPAFEALIELNALPE